MYVSITLKGKTEGVLAFVVPAGQYRMVLNSVHHDAGHQGQQRTLALTQERFWWPMMAEDCCAIVKGCLCCQAFEGEVPRAPLCPIWAYAPLELVPLDYTSIESMMELNKPPPPMVKNILMMMDHFTRSRLSFSSSFSCLATTDIGSDLDSVPKMASIPSDNSVGGTSDADMTHATGTPFLRKM